MRRLLLVEDSKLLMMTMKRILCEAGFSVIDTRNGDEALRLARHMLPDLIILDLMLPGLGGEVVLRRLKEDATTSHIPVVIISSLSQINADKLKNEGAIAYIEKSKLELENSDMLVKLLNAALHKSMARA